MAGPLDVDVVLQSEHEPRAGLFEIPGNYSVIDAVNRDERSPLFIVQLPPFAHHVPDIDDGDAEQF